MSEIIIKQFEEEDRESTIELLEKTFPGRSSGETFRWRFELNQDKKPLLIIAKSSNKVISFNSWIPWEFSYRNNKYLGYQSGESATDINYRGRGIFVKLLEHGYNIASQWGIDFFFGFPSKMSYGAFFKAGYYPISTYYFSVRLLNPFKKRVNGLVPLESISSFSSMLTEPDKITPTIDYSYCNWRYLQNPKKFQIMEFRENNSNSLFFLRKKKWKGLTELLLLDCHFSNYNELFVQNSFRFIDGVFSRKATYMRTFFNSYSDRGKAIAKYFKPIKSKFNILVVKPISECIDKKILLNCNCWDIMPHCVDEL